MSSNHATNSAPGPKESDPNPGSFQSTNNNHDTGFDNNSMFTGALDPSIYHQASTSFTLDSPSSDELFEKAKAMTKAWAGYQNLHHTQKTALLERLKTSSFHATRMTLDSELVEELANGILESLKSLLDGWAI